jgi:hypothetical protein
MPKPARKPSRSGVVQEFELVPITDPAVQAALDRVRRNRGTKDDRRLLARGGKKAESQQRREKR